MTNRQDDCKLRRQLTVWYIINNQPLPRCETLYVNHLNFTKWPNYGVVDNVSIISDFVKTVSDCHQDDSPLVVHCSGGVGRSGTFTAMYNLYRTLRTNDAQKLQEYCGPDGDLELISTVHHLRNVRHPWMVEGVEQYLLAYKTCLQLLKRANY